ncbi:hypothetical protein [Rhodopirellula sp. MGV]|uniref:hypothetical protein n=1 Tax=Rhodopirellula sp. MGV TaxID=2023130 RepID=UPI000B96F219|nr:hypothetical protein [Rhodopirellula sp. MGV]OYP28433.1 hypothetical protein CGZ80_26895 [Rhodopirellula sp. MGV]PNY38691.1 hypothetical protein C2E31_01885 [Rhodopirellula baltica]
MTDNNQESSERGIWLTSDQVHELRDHIQALKVGHSLITKPERLEPGELREICVQMGEAIAELANSPLFGPPEA